MQNEGAAELGSDLHNVLFNLPILPAYIFKRFVDLFPISFIQIRPERLYEFIHYRARR